MSAPAPTSQAAIDREWVRRRGLAEFVRRAWSQVEPAPLVWNWHMDAICEHLEAVTRREVRRLVINVPPGSSKSTIVSVLWPAWEWIHDPARKFICATFDDVLSLRDANRCRTLITDDWFQERWPNVRLPGDRSASTAKSLFYTTAAGFRRSITVRASVTGSHAHTHIIDDPIDPKGAGLSSGLELDEVLDWYRRTMSTRFCDLATGATVLIMQRLHERDLAAYMIGRGATVLCLPMRYDPAHPNRYAHDPRSAKGELLNPARFPADALAELETELGPTATAAQMQQRPNPAGGSIFQRAWLKNYWTVLPPGGTWVQSWDCTFKAKTDSDYVCGQVWYHCGANHYLVDQVLARLGFNDTCEAIKAFSKRYPRALKKLVEDKANGTAVIETLRALVPGMTPVEPHGGKEARAQSCEPLFAAGNVFIPHPERAEYEDGRRGAPWVRGGVALDAPEAARDSYEWFMVSFPKADHDDPVDATTQYLVYAAAGHSQRLKAAMNAVFGVTAKAEEKPQPVTLERMLVRLHSNEPQAVDATAATLAALWAGTTILRGPNGLAIFTPDGLATICTGNAGYVRFACERQGYVKSFAT